MFLATVMLAMAVAKNAGAISFGIFDARSTAMGGAGVASATSAHAVYFNPALLGTYTERKELTKDSYMGTVLAGSLSEELFTFETLQNEDYEGQLKRAIRAYNAANTASNAQAIVVASENLQQTLDTVALTSMGFDLHGSTVIAVPGKKQGGAFYIDSRLAGGGRVDLTPTDQQLLTDYIQGLKYEATGGVQGSARPALFNDQGQLRDYTGTLSSTAAARGALITEAGVAVAGEYELFGRRLSLGATPKVVLVSVFDYLEKASDIDNTATNQDWNQHNSLNIDVGAAYDLATKWRLGMVVKNLFIRHHTTRFGNDVEIGQQWRVGVAYRNNIFLAAADLDLLSNTPIAYEDRTQYLALGLETGVNFLNVRIGYRHNLAELTKGGNVTAGLGLTLWNIALDFAFSKSVAEKAAALQLGTHF